MRVFMNPPLHRGRHALPCGTPRRHPMGGLQPYITYRDIGRRRVTMPPTSRPSPFPTSIRPFEGGPSSTTSGMEALIEAAVERAIGRSLGPHLHRLRVCEPAVYTVAQAAEVLQVSEDTVGRIVRRGVLPRVPHVGGKVLIPRRALDRLIEQGETTLGTAAPRADQPPGASSPGQSEQSAAS